MPDYIWARSSGHPIVIRHGGRRMTVGKRWAAVLADAFDALVEEGEDRLQLAEIEPGQTEPPPEPDAPEEPEPDAPPERPEPTPPTAGAGGGGGSSSADDGPPSDDNAERGDRAAGGDES